MQILEGHSGTDHVTADLAGMANVAEFGSGDYVFEDFKFTVSAITNNEVRVYPGVGISQGRRFIISKEKAFDSVTIENGVTGYKRNDIIVSRYNYGLNGVESFETKLIKGTPVQNGNPSDPSIANGNIDDGEVKEVALFRVRLNGLSIEAVEVMYNTLPSIKKIQSNSNGMDAALAKAQADIIANANSFDYLNKLHSDGERLNNLLQIDTSNPLSKINTKAWGFDVGEGAVNVPTGCNLGIRTMEYFNSNWFIVKVFEFSPVMGRVWTNRYDKAQNTWLGWETLGQLKRGEVKTEKVNHDGKPIYRRSVILPPIAGASLRDTWVDTKANIQDFYVCQESYYNDEQGNKWPFTMPSNVPEDFIIVWYQKSTGKIYVRNAIRVVTGGVVTIEYTLTTD